MAYRISVDTGGTFTDAVVSLGGEILFIEKSLTTHDRISEGVQAAIALAASKLKLTLAELFQQTDLLIYGTTRSTNAIVEGKTARTALLVTEGFPDILLYREGGKARPHDSSKDFPAPYIPRRHTFEIPERINAEGGVEIPLDRDAAEQILNVIKERGFEAIAVSFLWSIVNPEHEIAVGEMISSSLPDVPFTLAHRLIPIVREYRRTSATAIDASLKPLMGAHLRRMEADLREAGYAGEILVSTSMGGCMDVAALAERPINTLKSGPAMAPIASRHYARIERLGEDVIVCDTGGTTFDVGLIRDGKVVHSRDTWLGGKWTGHVMAMSTVDMRSIGAGGGSIAHLDAGGLLRVGPQSAGSEPGPACYGNGGTEPTVTDAAVVLGYIDPDYFLGGRMKLDVEAARRVYEELAAKVGRSREETAWSVMNLANEHMIGAIQEITVNEGINPRDSAIVAGGGAAGMNIGMIAQELGCSHVLLPCTASALSASGMQFSEIVFEHSASGLTLTNDFSFEAANGALDKVREELDAFVATLGDRASGRLQTEYFVEARYLFQIWELDVPLPIGRFETDADVAALKEAFEQVHERIFAVTDPGSPVECVTWKGRVTCSLGENGTGALRDVADLGDGADAKTRPAFFGGDKAVDTPVHKGHSIAPGAQLVGPAIIEEPTTTIVVYPGMKARRSEGGNYILDVE